MKHQLIIALQVVFLLGLLLIPPLQSAQATSPYFVTVTYAGSNVCNSTLVSVMVNTSWNLPAGTLETYTTLLNGVQTSTTSLVYPSAFAGSNTILLLPPNAFPSTNATYTYSWTL